MLKFFFILPISLVACATAREYKELTNQVGNYGLQRFDDKYARCYVYRDSDDSTVSCIPKVKEQ